MNGNRTQRTARGNRRRLTALLLLLIVAALIYGWQRFTAVDLPLPDLAGADPAVIAAVEEAGGAVKRSPRSSDAWGALGHVLLMHGWNREAAEALARAESLDAGEFLWAYHRGLAVVDHAPRRARAAFERAAALAGNDLAVRSRLAETCLALGDTDAAEQHFQQMLAIQMDDARARWGLARAAMQRRQPDQAEAYLQGLVDNPYCRQRTWQLLARIHRHEGRPEAARQAAARAADLPADRPWPDPHAADVLAEPSALFSQVEQAKRLRQQGKRASSSQLIQRTEEQHPELYWLLEGRMCLQNGELPAAEDALRKSLALVPDFIEARFWLGHALLEAGKHAEARDAFQQILQLEPSYTPACLGLSRCLALLQQKGEAREALRDAIRYMPRHAEAHRELGRLLLEDGDLTQASIHLLQATQLDSNDEDAARLLSQCRARQQAR